jgi:hypothetical protein
VPASAIGGTANAANAAMRGIMPASIAGCASAALLLRVTTHARQTSRTCVSLTICNA